MTIPLPSAASVSCFNTKTGHYFYGDPLLKFANMSDLLACAPLMLVTRTLLWRSLFSLWKCVPQHMKTHLHCPLAFTTTKARTAVSGCHWVTGNLLAAPLNITDFSEHSRFSLSNLEFFSSKVPVVICLVFNLRRLNGLFGLSLLFSFCTSLLCCFQGLLFLLFEHAETKRF